MFNDAQGKRAPRCVMPFLDRSRVLAKRLSALKTDPGFRLKPVASISNVRSLAFRELEAAAGFRAAVLLTLNNAAVAR